jgi:polyferredoxin
VIDSELCAKHVEKSCYKACPWGLYPVSFRDNTACGLCLECLRACPQDNLALNLRPFGAEFETPRKFNRIDEAFMALIMLVSVLVFAGVFVGPWGWLKSAAFAIGSLPWLGCVVGFLTLNLLLLPGLFALAVSAGLKFGEIKDSLKSEIANLSQALLPLGLMAWIAFTISFALPKFGTIFLVLNDPFGWGWNLLGSGNRLWSPDIAQLSTILQAGFLLAGFVWSARILQRLTGAERRRSIPVLLFCLAFTFEMLWLLVG